MRREGGRVTEEENRDTNGRARINEKYVCRHGSQMCQCQPAAAGHVVSCLRPGLASNHNNTPQGPMAWCLPCMYPDVTPR